MEDLFLKIFVVFAEFLIGVAEGIMISNGLTEDSTMFAGYIFVLLLTYAAALFINFLIFTDELKE